MVPCSFAESNCIMDKPDSMSYDECEAIYACRSKDGNDNPVVISLWKLTEREMAELQKTGRLWLIVSGKKMQPVTLTPFNPLTDAGG